MTIDRAEVFRLAWVWAKQEAWSRRLPKGGARMMFAECLRKSWAYHKAAMDRARAAAQSDLARLSLADLENQIISLENCDARLGWERQERLSALRREFYGRTA